MKVILLSDEDAEHAAEMLREKLTEIRDEANKPPAIRELARGLEALVSYCKDREPCEGRARGGSIRLYEAVSDQMCLALPQGTFFVDFTHCPWCGRLLGC